MEGLTPEQQLLWDIFGSKEKDNQVTLAVEQFSRKSFPVDAVRVTADNLEEVSEWCSGTIRQEELPRGGMTNFIKVRVDNPLTERQTKAFVGDWVLYAGKGYKVYTDKAFRKSFSEIDVKPDAKNVFEGDANPGNLQGVGTNSANPGGTHG